MDVRVVDVCATRGTSPMHRMSSASKLMAFAVTLAAVVIQQNVLVVAAVTVMLVSLALLQRLPLRPILALAAYPGIFAAVFAFAAAPDALTGSLFVAKATAASLSAVVLVFTTPYPQVFAPLQRIVPGIVGDSMLMTYRSLFLLAEKFDHLRLAIRLRSGLSRGHPVRAARVTVSALGALVLYAFDLSQREYDVMRVRGYERGLRVSPRRTDRPIADVLLVAGAVAVLAVSVAFRFTGGSLTPYSWLPAAAASALLVAASLGRMIER